MKITRTRHCRLSTRFQADVAQHERFAGEFADRQKSVPAFADRLHTKGNVASARTTMPRLLQAISHLFRIAFEWRRRNRDFTEDLLEYGLRQPARFVR